jgi:hypothetical protein
MMGPRYAKTSPRIADFGYSGAHRHPYGKPTPLKILACVALMLLLAGCIPIGARVSNMYTQAPAPSQSA